jgi:anaerobic ribonucleoside-triphosphate reductase
VAGHEHDHAHDHDHDHAEDHGEEAGDPDISAWAATAPTTTCPACGAAGAVTLGGGVFCPTCGEISTNPGYQPPPAPAQD